MTKTNEQVLKFKNSFNKFSKKKLLNNKNFEYKIYNSIQYSFSTGGKRIRPYIIFFFGSLLKIKKKTLYDIGFSAELTHTYSLIHDDLPSMDDDDIRRGFPTIHKKFDEATAILCGDALQVISFENLVSSKSIKTNHKILLIKLLCKCSGLSGLISGQSLDLNMKKSYNLEKIDLMQDLKTGSLFEYCFLTIGIIKNFKIDKMRILKKISYDFGKIFQITDDLLDYEGDYKKVGKKLRKDSDNANIAYKIGKDKCVNKINLHKKNLYNNFLKLRLTKKDYLKIKDFIDYISKRDH